MRRNYLFTTISICILVVAFCLSGCDTTWLALPTSTPALPTMTKTATPEPTETRVWFPPTATHTPVTGEVHQTATPDLRPIDQDILLTDVFTQDSNWEVFNNYTMVAAYGVNELTLAMKGEKGTAYSFNSNPMPNDYYLEIWIEPSLCSGSDQYGVVFRSQSRQDFYRMLMSCDGEIRLDLVRGSSAVRLVETEQSAQIFSGPNAQIKLNLWLVNDGVQVFIDDVLQVEYYRLQWISGGIGVFARSDGQNALTVSFSALSLRDVNPLPPTPIPSATATPD